MGQFDDIFGVKTPDDSGVAVSGEYDDIFGIKPQRTLKTNLQDVAATAAKGITGLSDAAVGLANIPTMGQAGRAAQLVGLNEVYDDPMQAEQALQEHQQNIAAGKRNEFLDASPYSAPQQFAQKQVTDAEGVLGKLGAAVRNPSTIVTAVGESLPTMLAGGLAGRAITKAAPFISPVVGGAIGEGLMGAGSAAEQTRKETATGTLSPTQAAMNLASGIGTGIFGYAGGKFANKIGFEDVDTLFANGFARTARAAGVQEGEKKFAQTAAEVAGRIVGGGISEGAFEELPQSIQETMWQNAATGKPLTEGMDEAAVMGFLSGVAMGGPVNALPRPNAQSSLGNPQESPAPPQADPSSPDQAPFPTQEPPPLYTETVPGPETLQPPAPPVPAPGPISRAADMLARTTPGIMGKVMDPTLAPLPEDNLAGEWNAQEQQALAGNQARNFTRAEQAAYDLEQQRQYQQAEARRKADPLAAQKAAFEESYNAMGTVPESMGNITPDDAAAFERKVEFERATNRRQQYIKTWKQAEQEADTLTRDPEIPAAVKREARKQVREIVKADPVYEQMNEVKRRGGLNLEAMGQDYDRDTVNIINRRYPGIFSRVGSVKPDDFANEMGYDDLDAMVRRFSEARTQKELTASILKEKTGSWQNAESEQQAYAAKQAERKQGAEWSGAQGTDRVSRGIPARTVFPAPDEAVSAMESMIRRKPENFKEEDFDHWTYTAEQQGRLKQAYREATVANSGMAAPEQADPLPRDIGATQPARMERDTGEYLQGQRERRDFYRGKPATFEGDAQGFLRDQQGRQSFLGVDNTPQTVAANPDGFLRDQGIRRDAVGQVNKPIVRQPGESTRDFLKRRKAGREAGGESFDVGHASDAAYNQPQNAAIREAWTRAHMVQDSDGTARRMQHDHFDEWHAGGGVSSAVGSQYDAHGIAKSNPLGALLNLLQNGIDTTRRFDTAPLVTNSGTSAGLGAASGAYKDGPFIILGKKGKELKEGIHTVLVSDAVSDVIPQLQQRFQGVRFVKYSEAQATLENDSANVSPNPNDEPQADLSSTGEAQTRTDSFTNRIENVADNQSNQDVIVDKAGDKTAGKPVSEKSTETAPSAGEASKPEEGPTVKESSGDVERNRMDRLIEQETAGIVEAGGNVVSFERDGTKYYIESSGSFGWKTRGKGELTLRNASWEVIAQHQGKDKRTKNDMVEWGVAVVESKFSKAKESAATLPDPTVKESLTVQETTADDFTAQEMETEVDFTLFETGDGTPIRMPAQKAIDIIDGDLAIYAKLLKCVGA